MKFFVARDPEFVRDRSENQRIGELGITLHSFYTPKLNQIYKAAINYGLKPTKIQKNPFGEKAFVFTGPDGVHWEILEQPTMKNQPLTKREFKTVDN